MDRIQLDILIYLRDCETHKGTVQQIGRYVAGLPSDSKDRKNILDRMVMYGWLGILDSRWYFLTDDGRRIVQQP